MVTTARLQLLRDRLLRLHKTLLDAERVSYERTNGPVRSSGEFLQLVLGHEHFAWLRPFSGLIVRIDEWVATGDGTAEESDALWQEADHLTTIGEPPTDATLRYQVAIDRSADAAVAHAAARQLLDHA